MQPAPGRFHYDRNLLLTGSCFSESIGCKLREDGFRVCLNPYGIVYNPLTMADQLERLLEDRPFAEDELILHGGLWHSPWHHGRFSDPDPERTLDRINRAYRAGREALGQASALVLTWGQGRAFFDQASGMPVANCHKRPGSDFREAFLDLPGLVDRYRNLLERLRQAHPELQVWITVSPVRYPRQGMAVNSRSKAILHLLAEALSDETWYFPACEILLDELRDYRFFADDLLHPSPLAVDIIYRRFLEAALDPGAAEMLSEVRKIRAWLGHRPLHPDSGPARESALALQERLEQLRARWPAYAHLFSAPTPGG